MSYKNAIIILGGGLRKDGSGKWHTTNFNEKSFSGRVEGGRLRVIAAFYLYKNNPDILLISSGGAGKYKDIHGAVPVAEVMRNELLNLGVKEKNILIENKSKHSFDQLRLLSAIIKKHNIRKIIIISNKYHLPRVKAMIEYVDNLKNIRELLNNNLIKLKSAEDIVLKTDPKKWRKIIDRAYKSDDMKKRIMAEKQGVSQIKKGTYKFW